MKSDYLFIYDIEKFQHMKAQFKIKILFEHTIDVNKRKPITHKKKSKHFKNNI